MGENTQAAPLLGGLLAALAEAPQTAAKFDSWTGEGANQPITGDEIATRIAPETLTALAEKSGMSKGEAAAGLAVEIPALVDAIPAESIQRFRTARADRSEDTGYTAETVNYTSASILQQAGNSVLAQVNAQPKNLLPLLQQLG